MSNSNTSSTAPPSPVEKNFISSSAKKLKHIGTAIAPEDSSDFHDDSSEENSLLNTDGKELPHCFIFIDTDILKSIITLLAVCPDCNSKSIRIDSDLSKKKGLSLNLNFVCTTTTCHWEKSKEVKKLSVFIQVKKLKEMDLGKMLMKSIIVPYLQ